jgi:hypothetical protein
MLALGGGGGGVGEEGRYKNLLVKITIAKRPRDFIQVIKCLPSKHEFKP